MVPGNNIKALKLYRVLIPITRTAQPGEIPSGKFFFPDLPQIKNKLIVGIEAHIGGVDMVAVDVPGNQLSQRNRITPVPPQLSSFSFITLIDHKGAEIISQFPLFALANKDNPNIGPPPPLKFSRILPIVAKIDPAKCYVELPNISQAPYTTFIYSVSMTFYIK